MSATRRDLQSRMTLAATRRADPEAAAAGKTAVRTKPVRVTLNMPPELYRQLTRWADSAAEALDVPRVSVQDALRAMVSAGAADATPDSPALGELRRNRADLGE